MVEMPYFYLVISLGISFVSTTTLCPGGCRCIENDDTKQTDVICERLQNFPSYFPKRTAQLQILYSNLSSIPQNAFSQSPEIKSVYVRFSNVGIISSLAFTSLLNLSDIEFQRNNITRFESFAFSNMNVSSISIMYNNVDIIESHALAIIKADDQIVCSNNFIGELQTASFSDVKKTKLFQFQNNTIEIVRENCFTNFSSIRSFDFSNNHFLSVEPQLYDTKISTIFIMFSNSIKCNCEINWIFDNPFYKNFIDYNYCDVRTKNSEKIPLSDWYQSYLTMCRPTTTKRILQESTSPTSTTKERHPTSSSPNQTLLITSLRAELSSSKEKFTTASVHVKATSQRTHLKTTGIVDLSTTTKTSTFSTTDVKLSSSHVEEASKTTESQSPPATPRSGSPGTLGDSLKVKTGILVTLITCLFICVLNNVD
ncbi:leucine-rich repeat and fibronectin type-III domain-containing protein 5-like [Saccostrea cucullata]|uniref:leucine-rich repeat and fibronectin type-III domain-containing protein 5-like n=1 Tax=Saccostrea cuccullata TaxID=36930 RepID=UPI002ED1B9BF